MVLPDIPPAVRKAARRALHRGATASVLAALATSVAHAGPAEFIESLAQHPTDSSRLVLHYDGGFGGLLYSSDGGKTFKMHPSLAFTQSGLYRAHPAISYLANNQLVVGAPWDGLFVSDTRGCISAPSLELAGAVTSVAPHPADKSVVFFVGGTTAGARVGLWRRDASGAVVQLGADDGSTYSPEGLAVLSRADSVEQLRFVEVGTRPELGASLRYSDDLGQTWTERLIPDPQGKDGTPRLLAAQGGEVVSLVLAMVREAAIDPIDPILVTTDTGQTFATYLETVYKAGQAVLTPDGTLYLSDMGTSTDQGGLWVAEKIGLPLQKIADYSVHCLGFDGSAQRLYLCKAHELGHFDPVSHSYCRIFTLNETADLLCDLATLPRLQPDDILSIEQRVKEHQLCENWCTASHHASAPVCARYDDAALTCGLAARAYDLMSGWLDPPWTDEPRCVGFERVAPPSDTGQRDAGVGEPTADASSEDASSDEEAGMATPSDAALPAARSNDGGCSLGPPKRAGVPWWCVLAPLLLLGSLARIGSPRKRERSGR